MSSGSTQDAAEPGLRNNAYTNVMSAWVLRTALRVMDLLGPEALRELREKIKLEDREVNLWGVIPVRMKVPFHDDGIISQFEGYERLAPFDWAGYRKKYGDIHRLDRILEAEGDSPNRYQASKQADVLMLFYLFTAEQLQELFSAMGYDFDPAAIPRNIHYYLERTSNGSTLSNVVHSWVLSRSDRIESWKLFRQALESDISDIQGGTTHEVELQPGDHGEGTAWSCAHGVGRWTRDCGCSTGAPPGWNQAWRGPLRTAFDGLRDAVAELFTRRGKQIARRQEAQRREAKRALGAERIARALGLEYIRDAVVVG